MQPLSGSGPNWIGACGGSRLGVAFVLNLFGILPRGSRSDQSLNAAGASLAGYAAVALVARLRGVRPYTAEP